MQFRLIQTLVRSVHCEELQSEQDGQERLRYAPIFNENRPREFAVVFDIRVILQPCAQLKIDYLTVFETAEDISEEFRKSNFPRINAPAVAYPYVRAFVSQFSALAGFEPHTMPIRNFVKAESSSGDKVGE